MRRITGLLLAVGAFVALSLAVGDTASASASRAPVQVSIAVENCGADAVTITINPWQARVGPEDDLTWVHSGADSVMIEPVTRGNWPFPTANPRAARGAAASAGRMTRGRAQVGQVVQYAIVLYCGGRMLRIDPDIIIGD